MNYLKLFSNPKVAFITFAIWIVIFLLILKSKGVFSKKFLHFGPSTDPETQTNFLGSPIDTWSKVITLYILGFLSVLFSTYYHDIFKTWIINSVKDHKEKKINMCKITAYLLTIADPVLYSINRVLELFVLLTLQLQFFIPQIIGELFITIISTRAFLSKKKFNNT